VINQNLNGDDPRMRAWAVEKAIKFADKARKHTPAPSSLDGLTLEQLVAREKELDAGIRQLSGCDCPPCPHIGNVLASQDDPRLRVTIEPASGPPPPLPLPPRPDAVDSILEIRRRREPPPIPLDPVEAAIQAELATWESEHNKP
jgi:hypothetical protein